MKLHLSIMCGLAALCSFSTLRADDAIHEVARKLFADHGESIVTVKVVVDVEVVVGGSANQSQEQKIEAPATVIQKNGLTVLSNSTIDVGSQIKQQLRRQARGRDVDVKTTFKEVNLLLRDGTEIPSKVVLKDGDLDLAFVLPEAEEVEAEGVEFNPVIFPEATPSTEVLEPIILLNRLGQDLDRELSIYITKVEALIKKPRKFIVTHNSSTGTPAFLGTGEPLGLYVRRIVNGSAASSVVLPAKEVSRLAREAATAEPIEAAAEDGEEKEESDEEEAAEKPADDSDVD